MPRMFFICHKQHDAFGLFGLFGQYILTLSSFQARLDIPFFVDLEKSVTQVLLLFELLLFGHV